MIHNKNTENIPQTRLKNGQNITWDRILRLYSGADRLDSTAQSPDLLTQTAKPTIHRKISFSASNAKGIEVTTKCLRSYLLDHGPIGGADPGVVTGVRLSECTDTGNTGLRALVHEF